MAKLTSENRRRCTIMRDNQVHQMYKGMMENMGGIGRYVSKTYIYGKIGEEMGLSNRMVSFILNHTRSEC